MKIAFMVLMVSSLVLLGLPSKMGVMIEGSGNPWVEKRPNDMKVKKGVILNGLKIEMRPVLVTCNKVWLEAGQELVVTSGLDGAHSAGSLHYYGYALDLRTRYFKTLNVVEEVAEKVRRILGFKYDVIIHKTHLHVEYDPK